MASGLVCHSRSTCHSRYLLHPLVLFQKVDIGHGSLPHYALVDNEVAFGMGCDLGQMGDTNHLVLCGDGRKARADHLGHRSPHAGVDLVKDISGNPVHL